MILTKQKLKFFSVLLCILITVISCKDNSKVEETTNNEVVEKSKTPFFKLSLAQWSLHRTFNDDGVSPFDFAKIADSLGFDTIEFVSQLYENQIKEVGFDSVVNRLLYESQKYGLKNNLIMIDHEGDLADPSEAVRNEAVENHKKWVDAAQKLGCHAIRVNTFGTNDPELWVPSVVDGLTKLSEYAATKNINVLCENHGWLSSDTPILMDAINTVNMPNCGTLPDTGNFCTKRIEGAQWGDCAEHSEPYEGIKLMMPKAKGLSAKNVDFPDAGIILDYDKIIKIVKEAGFNGYIGIEFSGAGDEKLGILTIKDLLLKSAESVN
jgi:sugar phosphate isomerase/epimerase